VANIDLAPTILDMAGVQPPENMDGQSLLPLLQQLQSSPGHINWRHSLLIERG
jgi:arylsulfatase A-like enzyme